MLQGEEDEKGMSNIRGKTEQHIQVVIMSNGIVHLNINEIMALHINIWYSANVNTSLPSF